MNIGFIHDCAYVGFELRSELKRRGYNVFYYDFTKGFLSTFRLGIGLRKVNLDLIHAHYCKSPAYAALLSGKNYVVHCHGSDIRWGMSMLQRIAIKRASVVIVSTPDLIGKIRGAVWLPNPISPRFRPLRKHGFRKVLYFPHWYEDLTLELEKACKDLNLKLYIVRKGEIPYEKMHLFLNRFDIFVDRFKIHSYSKTALEAMACGLLVVGYKHRSVTDGLKQVLERRDETLKFQEKIVRIHNVVRVVDQLVKIYERVV